MMADKRPLRALDAFLTRFKGKDISAVSYSPSTGDISVSFHGAAPSVQPDIEPDEPETDDKPEDFRFALERFNDKPRQRQ